ncbi:hypothetical protein [Rhodobacter lacus]|uniref:Uncharacterized protein n=1 Tax=Rhodobacter lacus TaxID=1641972 RepID=A0ABW5A6P7_9RHOB
MPELDQKTADDMMRAEIEKLTIETHRKLAQLVSEEVKISPADLLFPALAAAALMGVSAAVTAALMKTFGA